MSERFQPDELREQIRLLRTIAGPSAPAQAERALGTILRPLLAHDGYNLKVTGGPGDGGVDFTALRPAPQDGDDIHLGIQFKHYSTGRPVSVSSVREAIGTSIIQPFDRFLLISTTGFTRAAIEIARVIEPINIVLVGPDELDAWVSRIQVPDSETESRVAHLIRSISHEFAVLVARNPRALEELEWRDLERMMARIMEGLGFTVTLTPASKDGGKDLILTCEVQDKEHTYIVELKHWRSGKRVGSNAVKDFLSVLVTEGRSGALFLSTSGYSSGAFEQLTEIERRQLRFGSTAKIIALAQTYARADSGLWSPPQALPEVLFEATA